MAPCSVPAGFRSSGVTSISSAPVDGSSTTMPASSRSGRSSVREPSNMVAIRPGDAGGFTGSVSRRCTRVNPIAPVATGSPSSVTTSTVATAERRPRRRMVVRVETKAGAGSGRMRTDMSEVNVQASGSSSSTTPAATSTRKATMLARSAPWRSNSGRGCRPRRNSPSWISATTPRRAGILKVVVEKVGHRWSGTLPAGSRSPPVAADRGRSGGPCRAMRRRAIPDKVTPMDPIDVDAFEALVADALEAIPDELRAEMENVAIIIDDESPPGRLYGLYEGIPLTKRGTYAGVRPDQITLFLRHDLPVGPHARGVGPPGARDVAPRGGPPLRPRRGTAARARLGLTARHVRSCGGNSLLGGRAGVATGGVEPLVLASPRFSLRSVESSTSAAPMRLVAS